MYTTKKQIAQSDAKKTATVQAYGAVFFHSLYTHLCFVQKTNEMDRTIYSHNPTAQL